MPLAAEHYRALMGEIDTKKIGNADEAAGAMRRLIADTQQLTLSQIDDSIARQLGSILFSHEAGLISALSCVNPPNVKMEKGKKATPGYLFLSMSMLLAAAGCALSWNGGEILMAVFFAAAEALASVAALWPKKPPEVQISQTLNPEALLQLGERRMEAIDRDMEAFLSLPSGDADADEGVLHLITKAVTLKKEDPDSIPDELMTAIAALTISRGYSLMDYSEGSDAFFDIMPTRRQTRTIVPAVLKGDRLLSRGMAIVTEDTAEEA